MEKILKKILSLIPILVISLFSLPFVVYAEEQSEPDYIIRCTWSNCWFDDFYDPGLDYSLVASSNFCGDKLVNIYYNDSGLSIQKSIIWYNSSYDYYAIMFFNRNFSDNSIYSDLNLNTNNFQFTVKTTGQGLGAYPYIFFYSTHDLSSYFNDNNNFDFSSSLFKTLNNEDFYFYGYLSTQYTFTKYITENINDFVVVSDIPSGFYINSTSVEIQNVCTTPEPEVPEEPEPTPTPIDSLDKIYVPNYKEGQCIEIVDKDTLRVFENENTNVYIDYFINSHYISKEGQTEVDYTKNCSTREFTSIGYYRNDFPEILFMIGSFCLFSIGFIFVLFKRFRKR